MNILDIIQFGIIAIGVVGLILFIIGTVQKWHVIKKSNKHEL